MGSRARHPFMLTVFFFLHPKANRQKYQRNNCQPQRSLCPHSAFPCLHHCPFASQSRTAGPATGGPCRACGCAELKSPGLPATHCCLPGSCLPRCLQADADADAAMEPLGRPPQGCIIQHPAGASCLLWAWLLGLAALWPPGKGAHLH